MGRIPDSEELFEFLDYYWDGLKSENHIWEDPIAMIPTPNGLETYVSTPMVDSLSKSQLAYYTLHWRERITREFGLEWDEEYLGPDPSKTEWQVSYPTRRLVISGEKYSPVCDLETFAPIPLYLLPITSDSSKNHEDLVFWKRNYIRVYGLWMNGWVDETWMQRQLEDLTSDLNQQGMECRANLEARSGIPTYYFLFNYRAISPAEDQKRPCPSCGNPWLLPALEMDEKIIFRCDPCRLVSEGTKNSGGKE